MPKKGTFLYKSEFEFQTVMSFNLNYFGTILYRLFVVFQLSLAVYYSHRAIKLWNESPIVVSGKQKLNMDI